MWTRSEATSGAPISVEAIHPALAVDAIYTAAGAQRSCEMDRELLSEPRSRLPANDLLHGAFAWSGSPKNDAAAVVKELNGCDELLPLNVDRARRITGSMHAIDANDVNPGAFPTHPDFDIHAVVLDRDGLPEEGWFDSYTTTIMERFALSPEASQLSGGIGWAGLLMDYARSYLGQPVARLAAAEVEELVFEIFPRKVSCDTSEAPEIVRELRAFFTFLKREFALSSADLCLAPLAGDAEQRLASELADSSNFGMAKSFVMAGTSAGFDMTTENGLQAWSAFYNARVLARETELAPVIQPQRRLPISAERKTKKVKRKQARKSRRKNR